MSSTAAHDRLFAHARKVADAVLYEGYVLYPYRASAGKNRIRWQFGVLAPRAWSEAGGCEEWWAQTECLLETPISGRVIGRVRFLQVRRRRIEAALGGNGTLHPVTACEVDGRLLSAWEEGIERQIDFDLPLANLLSKETVLPFAFDGQTDCETIHDGERTAARVIHEQLPIAGDLRLRLDAAEGPADLFKLNLRVENVTPCAQTDADRDDLLQSFFVGVHSLLALPLGSFLSLTDPPPRAADAAAACRNQRAWPAIIGEDGKSDVLLASPIILEDHPRVAPESAGDLCDATEIDEILMLRTLTLTDEEKREARATDARAAAIIDRADNMPPELLERLHGTIRELRRLDDPEAVLVPTEFQADENGPAPWWDPASEAGFSPETDSIDIAGVTVAKGTRVRLCPGQRRADAQDMFLAGRIAIVQGVYFDVDERRYLAVALEDDPAADLHQWHGRYFYFAPDEVEPLEAAS